MKFQLFKNVYVIYISSVSIETRPIVDVAENLSSPMAVIDLTGLQWVTYGCFRKAYHLRVQLQWEIVLNYVWLQVNMTFCLILTKIYITRRLRNIVSRNTSIPNLRRVQFRLYNNNSALESKH